jgi:putative membrane protein
VENKHPTVDSKYIQQHLANERTYLAWLRTSVAIMGVGTLAATLEAKGVLGHEPFSYAGLALGLLAILMGAIISVVSTYNYLSNRKSINDQTFRAVGSLVWWVTAGVVLLAVILGFYIYEMLHDGL